jgi:hypothetical protein
MEPYVCALSVDFDATRAGACCTEIKTDQFQAAECSSKSNRQQGAVAQTSSGIGQIGDDRSQIANGDGCRLTRRQPIRPTDTPDDRRE